MTVATLSQIGIPSYKPHGWVASMLLHVFAVGVSIFLFTELKPAAEPEPFHWEISLAQVAQPSPQVEPPTPVPPQQKRVVQPPPAPARVQTVQTVPRVEPVVRQEQVALQKINPVIESIAQHAEPVQQERHTEYTSEVVQRAEATEVPVGDVTTPALVSQPAPIRQPDPTAVTEVPTHDEPVVTNASQVAEAPMLNQQTAVEATPQTMEVPAPVGETARVPSSHPVVERPAMVTSQTKADYSWLTQEFLARLELSKRYPYLARMNRWEGTVVVQAVVRDDGQVISLKIAESSGRAILDNDAMELIRKISPLHLKHPLGQSQVVLLVPVGYALQ